MNQPAFRNRLEHETSPYLKQHARNPVDWYPWGPEALQRARELDRPIFLSIGYSACHWCHVMEHESFEDEKTAGILNENYVSIKVDREERPDLDQIYMTAVQMLTGQGGWPMSMFLTPQLEPFFGGTYFPPDDRHGQPSFQRVLLALIDYWKNKRDELLQSAKQLTEQLQNLGQLPGEPGAPSEIAIRKAVSTLRQAFDSVNGGFGSAPKFPHPMELRVMLRAWKRFGDDEALQMARRTFDRMAMGGINDHLGGGFHRYSTDERWLVPHFEKMLYDNALLSAAYLEAYQATGDGFYRSVVEDTLAYVQREMTSPEGPFYSTQDADSEGVEGKFFVWSAEEIEKVLGANEAKLFGYVYGVSPEGNWEGHTILNRSRPFEQDARALKMDAADLQARLLASRRKLLEVRGKRIWPGRDEKMLTAWNGLMIQAFAQAAAVLDRPEYAQTAARAAAFILERMRDPAGRLFRSYSTGSEPKLNAYLEDYAFFLDSLVSLYEATFDPRWIASALDVARVMLEEFWDAAAGGFFFTGRDHEPLISRAKDAQDSSTPSGNAMAVTAMLRLAKLTGNKELQEKAETVLHLLGGLMDSSPLAAGQLLLALDFHKGPVQEFAIVGAPASEETRRVLRAIHGKFRPGKVIALKPPKDAGRAEELVPLLKGKESAGKVTTYVCENFACKAPLVGAEAAEKVLAT